LEVNEEAVQNGTNLARRRGLTGRVEDLAERSADQQCRREGAEGEGIRGGPGRRPRVAMVVTVPVVVVVA
jgi:hypothetical protein